MPIPEPAPSKGTIVSPFHVLLVSPNPDDHALLPALLSSVDGVVYHAFTCAEAIDILNRCVAPVIVTERTLADGDWTKILQAASLQPDPAKVIVLSAPGDYQFWADALNLGAFDVLYRPLAEITATGAIVLGYERWKRSAEQMSARAENMRAGNGGNGRTAGTWSNGDGPAVRRGGLKLVARARAIPFHDQWLRSVLPDGNGLVLITNSACYSSYRYEGGEKPTSFICVSGYLFSQDQFARFSEQWTRALDGLKYFRVKESMDTEHAAVYRNLIQVLGEPTIASQAFGSSLLRTEFDFVTSLVRRKSPEIIRSTQTPEYLLGGSYTFCAQACLRNVGQWLASRDYTGNVAYAFDESHEKKVEADYFRAMVREKKRDAELNEKYRVVSHAFADADVFPALQAADFLSWHLNKGFQENRWLPELEQIASSKSQYVHFTADMMKRSLGMTAEYNRGASA